MKVTKSMVILEHNRLSYFTFSVLLLLSLALPHRAFSKLGKQICNLQILKSQPNGIGFDFIAYEQLVSSANCDEQDSYHWINRDISETSLDELQILYKGLKLSQSGNQTWAIKVWKQEPRISSYWYNQGLHFYADSRWEDAIKSFNVSLEIDSNQDTVPINYFLANAYLQMDNKDLAIEYFKKIVQQDKNLNTLQVRSLWQMHMVSGDFKDALKVLDISANAAELSSTEINVMQGQAFSELSLFHEASEAYKRALTYEPNNITIIALVSQSLRKQNRNFEAFSYLATVANLPADAFFLQELQSLLAEVDCNWHQINKETWSEFQNSKQQYLQTNIFSCPLLFEKQLDS